MWHIDPFFGNDRETNNETKVIARQQFRKYTTVLKPLLDSGLPATMEAVFSMIRCEAISLTSLVSAVQAHVEAGSNTSTVALRVVGGDEKGTQYLGV
jgi:hypothetical protein